MTMIDICELIENGTRTLIEEKGLEAGNYYFHIQCKIVNKESPICKVRLQHSVVILLFHSG